MSQEHHFLLNHFHVGPEFLENVLHPSLCELLIYRIEHFLVQRDLAFLYEDPEILEDPQNIQRPVSKTVLSSPRERGAPRLQLSPVQRKRIEKLSFSEILDLLKIPQEQILSSISTTLEKEIIRVLKEEKQIKSEQTIYDCLGYENMNETLLCLFDYNEEKLVQVITDSCVKGFQRVISSMIPPPEEVLKTNPSKKKMMQKFGVEAEELDEIQKKEWEDFQRSSQVSKQELQQASATGVLNKKALLVLGHDPSRDKVMQKLGLVESEYNSLGAPNRSESTTASLNLEHYVIPSDQRLKELKDRKINSKLEALLGENISDRKVMKQLGVDSNESFVVSRERAVSLEDFCIPKDQGIQELKDLNKQGNINKKVTAVLGHDMSTVKAMKKLGIEDENEYRKEKNKAYSYEDYCIPQEQGLKELREARNKTNNSKKAYQFLGSDPSTEKAKRKLGIIDDHELYGTGSHRLLTTSSGTQTGSGSRGGSASTSPRLTSSSSAVPLQSNSSPNPLLEEPCDSFFGMGAVRDSLDSLREGFVSLMGLTNQQNPDQRRSSFSPNHLSAPSSPPPEASPPRTSTTTILVTPTVSTTTTSEVSSESPS